MADRYQELLNIYTESNPLTNEGLFDTSSMPQTKQAQIEVAAKRRQQEVANQQGLKLSVMRNTGSGVATADPMEQDFIKLSPFQFELKYGAEARQQLSQAAGQGEGQYRQAIQGQREGAAIVGDAINSAVTGLGNSVLGIGALGLGLVDDDAGQWAAEKLGEANQFMKGMQSRETNRANEVYTATTELDSRDNKAEADQISKEYGTTVGAIARFGKDALDSLGNAVANPTVAADTVASGVGSLFAGGIVSKGLKAVGKATIGKAVSARIGAVAGEKVAMPAAIGLMEGGGAYQQTTDAAYQQLIAQGVPHEEAVQRANAAGLEAAAIQAPVAALTGTIVSKFEGAPLRVPTLRAAGGNMVKEAIEETLQSGAGQVAQNLGIRDNVNANQDLMEGVGEQAALGGLGGLGSAGVAQSPGIALRGAIETAKLPFRAVGAGLRYQGERVAARNQKVQDAALQAIYEGAEQSVPEAEAEISRAEQAGKMTAEAAAKARETLVKVGNHPIMQEAAKTVRSTTANIRDRLTAMGVLADKVGDNETEQEAATPADLAGSVYQSVKDTVANTVQSANVQAAMATGKKLFTQTGAALNAGMRSAITSARNTSKADPNTGNITEGEWTDVQDNVPLIASMAEVTPEEVDAEVVKDILYHDQQGNITLTPKQRATFRSAEAVSKAAQKGAELGAKYGLSDAEAVSRQVLTDAPKDGTDLSLNGHLQGIRSAYNAGDTEVATQRLTDLRRFAEHLSNKVVSFNDALAGGHTDSKNPVTFSQLVKGKFRPTGKTYLALSPNGIKIAQHVGVQAAVVAEAVNNLSAALGLSVEHIGAASLDASLDGDANTVAKAYARKAREVPANETVSAPKVAEQAEQVEAPSPESTEPEATAEPANSEQTQEEPAAPVEEPEVEAVEPQAEKVPTVEEKSSETVIENAPQEPESTDTAPVSSRIGGEQNRVERAFKAPTEARTRIAESDSPLQTIKDALSSEGSLLGFMGNALNRRFDAKVASDYADLLAAGDRMLTGMNARMQDILKGKLGRLAAEELLGKLESGALNAVIQNAEGEYVYDPKIVEPAVLAALQWLLKMNSHGAPMTDADVRGVFGLDDNAYIPEGLPERLASGLSPVEVSRSLAQEIGKYLGMSEQANVPMNEAQAVKEGLAKELILQLMAQGLIEEFPVDIQEISTKENVTHVNRYRPAVARDEQGKPVRDAEGKVVKAIPADAPIRGFPNAIEKAVLKDAEELTYVGTAPTTVEGMQLRTEVPITEQQTDVIKTEQAIPHRLNLPFVETLTRMGEDMVLKLFAGELPDTLNENHKRSLEGRRLTMQSAFRSMQALVAEVQNANSIEGADLSEMPVFFRYAYTSVNRLQMLGKDNPQSSKLMREAILPTWDELDLTTPENRVKFSLGLAQALGVKVHTLDTTSMLQALNKKLAGFEQTLKILDNKNVTLSSADVDVMKSEGLESPVMLHALMEYARLQKTPVEERKAFKTALYFEADGVTNGVVNAMSLFTSGSFTENWLSNIERGGLWIGEQVASLANLRGRDAQSEADLYGVAARHTAKNVIDLKTAHTGKDTGEQMSAVLHVLSVLLPKGITDYDEKAGKLVLDRGAVKNPLTITIYGSGANGIAGNVLDDALSSLYERFSVAAARQKADPSISDGQAFFGGDKQSADARWAEFATAMGKLGANALALNNEGKRPELYVRDTGVGKVLDGKSFTDFTVNKAAKKALQDNILHAFVNPMVRGITTTVGDDLIKTMQLIKTQTQSWSLVGQFMYQNAYEKALAAKRKADPTMGTYDLLSKAEEQAVRQEVAANLPSFGTGTQNFAFGGQQRLNFPFMTSQKGTPLELEFSRGLKDELSTPAYGYMPGDAGVSGQPNMTIGTGDGQAVQNIITNPDTPKRRIQIFDGIHSTVGELDQMGLAANKGVYDSWQRNPLADLTKAFDAFAQQVDLSSLTEEQRKALAKSLFSEWTEIPSVEEIEQGIKDWAKAGLDKAENIGARQRVLARVQLSVDQMAGAATPFSKEGLVLSGSASQKAIQLNQLLAAEKAKPVEAPESVETVPVAQNQGEVTNTPQTAAVAAPVSVFGAMTEKAINKLTSDKLTRALLRDVVRSGRVNDYAVHTGTREDLIERAAGMGIGIPADRAETFMGFMDPNSKQLFVVDGNPETVLHELIHAATYETLRAHYDGETVGPEVSEAITRLEGLMSEFRDAGLEGEGYQNALDEMDRQQAEGNQAAELNEFMAWALANPELQEQLTNTTVKDKALRIARSVVRALKSLLFGGKRSAAVKDDLFSNIRFNTSILMRSAPTASQAVGSSLLYHDPGFGSNQRISDLMASLKAKVADFVGQEQFERVTKSAQTKQSLVNAARVMKAFDEAGFAMTRQEQMAFMHMVSIMGTAAALDANAASRMQDMYQHVLANLSVEDFLRDPDVNDIADSDQANRKFNLIAGKFAARSDALDRSVILPAFVALAQTNDEFRDIIRKIEMPKGKYAAWNSVDNVLDNFGDMAMDAVGRAVSGEGLGSKTVQQSVDNLVAQMLQTNAESELFIEKYLRPVGNLSDKINDKFVEGFAWLGKKAQANVDNVRANSNSKIRKALAESALTLTGLLHEETGLQTAMNAMSAANRNDKLWKPFYDLVKDLVGRTSENAAIYDLIKLARFHVSSLRQQFVEELPKIINGKFSRELTDAEQEAMHRGLAQTDLAALLVGNSVEDVLGWVKNAASRDVKAKQLMDQIRELSPANADLIETKANQLAEWMVNKKTDGNLLRNADAIAHLLNEGRPSPVTTKEMVTAIDQLVSLRALGLQSARTSIILGSLVQSEADGLNFVLNTLRGQRELDQAKATGNGRFNHYKGFINSSTDDSSTIVVVHDNDRQKYIDMGFTPIGALKGSEKDPSAKNRAYWYAPVTTRAPYSQGIAQNVQQSVSGVDKASGFSIGLGGGIITDPKFVAKLNQSNQKESMGQALLPVFDAKGKLYAYERQVDPAIVERMKPDRNLAKMVGVRAGRQAEEATAFEVNKILVDNLRDMWDRDRKAKVNGVSRANEYVDLLKSDDPIVKDSVGIFSNEMRAYIEARFPEGFMVRRDMVDDAIGYRNASIGDAWTGNSRWSEQTQKMVKDTLTGMFGSKAYVHAVRAEKFWQNAIVQDIRTMIVIRSVVVPMANAASNVYQLISRGVPVVPLMRAIPKKTAEIEAWHKTRIEQMEAEAELLATTDPLQRKRLEAKIKTIGDSHRRLSIWPLLAAGEFSSISDAGSREDVLLTQGKLSDFVEAQIDKLPGGLKTAGKYAIISKDTALFRALQKTVDYGDFVAKAVLYDDLTGRKKMSKADALARITEEFVNYDRLPGRDRQYLESIGLLWFWNFKVRSAKVALSMIRNNPVHALMAANLPTPISGIGLPLEDNLWASLFDGRLFNSLGFHMGFRAPGLLPIGNLFG